MTIIDHLSSSIARLAARWQAHTSGYLGLSAEDVAQELALAAVKAENRKAGLGRIAVRKRYAELVRQEMLRKRLLPRQHGFDFDQVAW